MDKMKTHGENGVDNAETTADQVGDSPEASETGGATRRRLLKGGLIGAPVILTQYGRPAWAGGCSESALASETMSDVVDCTGEGCSPGFWKEHQHLWHPNYQPDRDFSEVFGVVAYFSQNTNDPALLSEVIDGLVDPVEPANCQGNCTNQLLNLGFQTVAALQNAANDVAYDLTVLEVIVLFLGAYNSADAGQMELAKNELDELNNQFCPLDSHGNIFTS